MTDSRSQIHSEDQEDGSNCGSAYQVITALLFTKKHVAAACYDELQNCIYTDVFPFDYDNCRAIIDLIKVTVLPTQFLLKPDAVSNSELLELITRGTDGSPNCYRYQVIKSSAWNEALCTNIICSTLFVRRREADVKEQPASFHATIHSCVDMDHPSLRTTLGVLTCYLQENIFHLDDNKVSVAWVAPFPQKSILHMDQNTYAALQIFSEEVHPNWIKGKGKSKEGFSMFGVFDRTTSTLGRKRLRHWLSTPFATLAPIQQRQRAIAFTAPSANLHIIKRVNALLKHVKDVPRALLRIKKVESTWRDWCELYNSLANGIKIIFMLKEVQKSNPPTENQYIEEVQRDLDLQRLQEVLEKLQSILDIEESESKESIMIKQGYDAILDRKRELYEDLEGYLVEAAQKILEKVPILQSISVEYVPQIGYLVVIPSDQVDNLARIDLIMNSSLSVKNSSGSAPSSDVDEGLVIQSCPAESVHSMSPADKFQFIFKQAENYYFKNNVVLEMDEAFGDIRNDIQDRTRVILLSLEEFLLANEADIQLLSTALADLDAAISLGAVAREQGLVPPEIVQEPVIIIKNGRHILQELTVYTFVANDTYITPEKNIALVTGPNSSGKSVYLKQVGLIVFLAHIGSWVPCDHAIIGLTDRIMTRICTVDTITNPFSAFIADTMQMSKMLHLHTERTLCLIDEFGKGTNPVDGMAFMAAIIRHFAKQKAKTIFAMHFSEILQDDLLIDSMLCINCFTMETIADQEDAESADEDMTSIIPLYKLKFGCCRDSQGIACAKAMGVQDAVVRRALTIKHAIGSNKPIAPQRSESLMNNARQRRVLEIFLKTQDWSTASEEDVEVLRSMFPVA